MKLEVSLSQAAAIALALTLEAQAAERNAADCKEAGTLYADSWRGIAKSMKEIGELVQSQRKLALQKDEQTSQAAQDDEKKGGRETEKGVKKVELIDTKKITSELLDVLSRHDLAVADAIRMLEMTKNKILVTTKIKSSSHNLINAKKAVQAIVLDCLNTPNDEFSKVLQSEGGEIK